MTVLTVDKDTSAKTMVITSEFDAPVDQVWQLWADPRLLERWWGPPTYPATVDLHDLTPGGKATYFMTSPEGDKFGGYWDVEEVEAPTRLILNDGFASPDGVPNDDMPRTRTLVEIVAAGDKTRMVLTSTFASTEDMEQLLEMGMDEGMREAMGQIDAILVEVAP